VFERPGRNEGGVPEVFGCAGRRGRPVLLGTAFDCFSAEPTVGSVSNVRLRGRLAAYSAQMCEGANPAGTVVRFMHPGERRLLVSAAACQAANSGLALDVTDVEFGPHSAIAWVATDRDDVEVNEAFYGGPGCAPAKNGPALKSPSKRSTPAWRSRRARSRQAVATSTGLAVEVPGRGRPKGSPAMIQSRLMSRRFGRFCSAARIAACHFPALVNGQS